MSLRYAILHHTGVPEPHFDLLFETYPGSDLAAWRSPAWPVDAALPATRLKDHRRLYLDFEGEVSRGRGHVERLAAGTCDVEVGPDGVWVLTLTSGSTSQRLRLRPTDQGWTIEPVD